MLRNLNSCGSSDVRVDKVVKRLSKHVFAVTRIRKFVSRNVLIFYYRSFIEPIAPHGLLIYGYTTSSNLCRIYMVQRKLFKLIFFTKQRKGILPFLRIYYPKCIRFIHSGIVEFRFEIGKS